MEGFYYPNASTNTLGNWDNQSGYYIKLNTPVELSFEGGYIPNTEIELEEGWNLIPVQSNTPVSIIKLFGVNISKVVIIKDVVGMNMYWLDKGIFSLQELMPGKSYFVKLNEGFTISFDDANTFSCGDVLVDERDGQEYETVQIGDQCWMAENLNVGEMIDGGNDQTNNDVIEKYCYNNSTSECDEYGGLYQWNEVLQYNNIANGVCPVGWSIPASFEFCQLATFLDPQVNCGIEDYTGVDAGGKMKEAGETHWYLPNTGATNESGFTGLPTGYTVDGNFYGIGNFTVFWTSTTYGSYSLGWRLTNTEARTKWQQNNRQNGFPVRCLKEPEINLPPTTPSSPIPINGSGNQSLEADLYWSSYDPEGDQLTFDVYFGTDEMPPQVTIGQTEISFDPGVLDSDTQYFWKVVADDGQGNVVEGPIWSFTTLLVNLPPYPPSNPMPEDGAENQSIETDISWECSDPENDNMVYLVYFGKDTLPGYDISVQLETTFDPGTLEPNTEYFWQIQVYDYEGNFAEGPVWSFTTEE